MFFISTSFSWQSSNEDNVSVEDDSWKLRKDKNGIKVYTRDRNNTGMLEYKVNMIIETDIDQLIHIINNVEKYPSWMANCKSAELYKTITDTSRIEYMTTSVPWPLQDRDVAFEFVISKNTNNSFEAYLKAVPEALPEKEKYVRIKNSEGSWIFNKVEDGKVEIIHQFYGDPEGNIPNWIINMFIVNGPYKTIQNLNDLCNPSEKK